MKTAHKLLNFFKRLTMMKWSNISRRQGWQAEETKREENLKSTIAQVQEKKDFISYCHGQNSLISGNSSSDVTNLDASVSS